MRRGYAFYIETALKPVLRRELRNRPVFRNKYLTLRTGYRRQNTLTRSQSSAENRGILELTSRYQLPWQLVVADRNCGEFRFIEGRSFSARYGHCLRLERDFTYGRIDFSVYVFDEVFYDSRFSQWTPNKYGIGMLFPVGRHVVLSRITSDIIGISQVHPTSTSSE